MVGFRVRVMGYSHMTEAESDVMFVCGNSTETGPQRQTACEQETAAD